MEKEKLIEIVKRLQTADFTSDEEGNELMMILEKNVLHPRVSDLIFWDDRELSAEEIIEESLSYQPIPLSDKFD